jgi:hypothetical protein
MGAIFGGPKIPAPPPPPPPPPNPPTAASGTVSAAGAAQRAQASAAAGAGFDNTLLTGPGGVGEPETTAGGKALTGQ